MLRQGGKIAAQGRKKKEGPTPTRKVSIPKAVGKASLTPFPSRALMKKQLSTCELQELGF